MKRFLKWTIGLAALGAGSVMIYRGVQAGRGKLKNALGQAEAVTAQTRAALEQTEGALHTARRAI